MYVLLDLEWTMINERLYMPTQLAAIRVNASWQVIDQFFTLFRPHKLFDKNWQHVAFTGHQKQDFLSAPTVFSALESFEQWLLPDDILCWWLSQPPQVLSVLFNVILNKKLRQKTLILRPYFVAYVNDGRSKHGDPYAISKARGWHASSEKHNAYKDVRVLRSILKETSFDQSVLAFPVPEKKVSPPQQLEAFLDKNTGLVHVNSCPEVSDYSELKGFAKLSSCITKGYRPCPTCCMAVWNRTLVERNTDIVKRSECHYFFFKNSSVFHSGTCYCILHAKSTFHTVLRYDTCIKAGRMPCKRCKPIPGLYSKLTRQEQKAYNRYKQARTERDQQKDMPLRGSELTDMITLTSTGYAFWSAPGYSTFHLRECPKLKNMRDVIGFAKYDDAIHARYQPCHICKPTKKQDVRVSIPIHNRVREDESIDDILNLCEALNLSYYYHSPLLEVTTPVGKWRIHTGIHPIIVDHMPLKNNKDTEPTYHRQHRIFLSLTDTLHYIKRHDSV